MGQHLGWRPAVFDIEIANSALEMAAAMELELLTEEEYRQLQTLGDFDTRTSSWVKTPSDIRTLGGAVFCDHRYGHVFLYHNGAESYYAARGVSWLAEGVEAISQTRPTALPMLSKTTKLTRQGH